MESVYPYLPAKLGTWQYPYPPLLTLANTWTQTQTFNSHSTNWASDVVYWSFTSNTQVTMQWGGYGQLKLQGNSSGFNMTVNNYYDNVNHFIQIGVVPSSFSPSVTSGTVYQNTTYSYQTLVIPVYASTAGTAGSVAIALGPSSIPAGWGTQYVSGSTSSTACTLINLRVPPQWYYSVTVTDATIGTPAGIQE